MAAKYYEYVIRRTLQVIPVLFGVSIIIFVLTRIVPGAPVALALGRTATPEQIEEYREEMGLNDPIHVQYIDWIQGILRGNWGTSLTSGNNVLDDILIRLPATLELVFLSLLIAVVLSIPFGVIAASNQNKLPDHASRLVALFGISMPRFWIAIVLQVIFVGMLSWFPLFGRLSQGTQAPPSVTHFYLIDSLIAGQVNVFFDALHHIILPAISLSLIPLAVLMRLIRSDYIEQQKQDYVLGGKANGVPLPLMKYKYILKNSLTSALTLLGLQFGGLIGGAFFVEIVFVWPGVAKYGVDVFVRQDFNSVVGVTLLIGFAFSFANLIVDLLYGYLDPRVRMRRTEE